MKKIEKISIAGISFTLDSDAYVSLKEYLDSLRKYYSTDPDGGEIISDIEARIAELILDEQVYTKIVRKQLIDTIVAQLGSAEEIDDDTEVAGAPGGWTAETYATETKIPRRLYRSREGRVLGGVFMGIANYLNTSVAWVRLVFLLPFVFRLVSWPFRWHFVDGFMDGWSSVFIVTYIVLWIAMPVAKTPRQRLEAKGEKITSSSIRQNLMASVRSARNPNPSTTKAASIFAEVFAVLGRVVLFLVKFIFAVVGFSLLFTALVLFVSMIIILCNLHASSELMGLLGSIEGMSILSPLWLVELIILCVMIPVFAIGVIFLAFTFSWRISRSSYGLLLVVWGLAMVFTSVVLIMNASFLRDHLKDGVELRIYDSRYDSDNSVEIRRLEIDENAVSDSLSLDGAVDSLSRETLTPLN